MTEMFGEAWPPMSVPDLAPDDDDDYSHRHSLQLLLRNSKPRALHVGHRL